MRAARTETRLYPFLNHVRRGGGAIIMRAFSEGVAWCLQIRRGVKSYTLVCRQRGREPMMSGGVNEAPLWYVKEKYR